MSNNILILFPLEASFFWCLDSVTVGVKGNSFLVEYVVSRVTSCSESYEEKKSEQNISRRSMIVK